MKIYRSLNFRAPAIHNFSIMHDAGISIIVIFLSWISVSIIYAKNFWNTEPIISIFLSISLTVLTLLLVTLFSKIDPNTFVVIGSLLVFIQIAAFTAVCVYLFLKTKA